MVVANEKLMDNAATSVQSVVTDKDMLNRLNNLLAAADKKTNPVQEKTNPVNVTPSPVTPSVDPMMLLMQLQGVLALPDGLAKVLGHENVVAARKSTPVVEEFCSAVEAAGPMAALGFLGRPEAMDALTSILPGVLADIKTSSTPPDDEVEDIYD
jgi:hypothetical protein